MKRLKAMFGVGRRGKLIVSDERAQPEVNPVMCYKVLPVGGGDTAAEAAAAVRESPATANGWAGGKPGRNSIVAVEE